MKKPERLKYIPPYLFARLDALKEDAISRGVDIIDLGVGDPDLPTPQFIIEALKNAADNPLNHRYPPYEGTREFKEAVADYYHKRYNVKLDPSREIIALIGSKEGLGHIFWGLTDPGEICLIPDPAYPVYAVNARLAGAEVHFLPLLEENGFLPDLKAIPRNIAEKARLLVINYPNNPTAGIANEAFFEELVRFAQRNEIILCHDNAYGDIYFDGVRTPSILQFTGSHDCAVEFGSLSKPYNMTGWRVGYAVGNHNILQALSTIKKNIDSGVPRAILEAGVIALRHGEAHIARMRELYSQRRNIVVEGLKKLGWDIKPPAGSFYIWARVTEGMTSESFTAKLLEKTGVLVSPGNGYGKFGEGYFRISLTSDEELLKEAMQRMKDNNIGLKEL